MSLTYQETSVISSGEQCCIRSNQIIYMSFRKQAVTCTFICSVIQRLRIDNYRFIAGTLSEQLLYFSLVEIALQINQSCHTIRIYHTHTHAHYTRKVQLHEEGGGGRGGVNCHNGRLDRLDGCVHHMLAPIR